jgi:hypothetical protein
MIIIGHNCRIKSKQSKKSNNNKRLIESLHLGLNHAFNFFDDISADDTDDRYILYMTKFNNFLIFV